MKFRISALLACALCLAATPAIAATQYTFGPFILNVRSAGETFLEDPPPYPVATATGNFSAAEMNNIAVAMNFWVERIGGNFTPGIIINLAKVADPGGTAYNHEPYTGRGNPDTYDYIVNGQYYAPNPTYGYHTEIVFQYDYPAAPTGLLINSQSFTDIMAHEMTHALGMAGGLRPLNPHAAAWDQTSWVLDTSSAWTSRLYDVMGTKGVNGMVAFNAATPTNRSGGDFVLPDFNADPTQPMASHPGQVSFFPTFHGEAVDALTNGKGLPVMGGNWADYRIDSGNVLGHTALTGTAMSYSMLRNILFPEVELAALKDMGYAIDLKQFFGKSYYPTNLGGFLTTDTTLPAGLVGAYLAETAETVINTAGFNSAASYGTGLHVYRDKLNVTQAANINASGYGAGGIRVDGVGNTVTIPSGVTVAANGSYGTGLLVSYGKGNVINLNGVVEATGPQGIGAHFGISAYTYSYYWESVSLAGDNSDDRYFYTKMNSDLYGALVDSFNIAGSLTGSSAAIRINPYTHVKAINFMQGATIKGDILSEWNPWYTYTPVNYGTAINVGVSDAAGTPDTAFTMRYDGNMYGPASFNLNVAGGTFSYNGTYSGLTAAVQAGATLKGNATYQLYADCTDAGQAAPGGGTFTNAGTIAPGNSIGAVNIAGNFTNTGTLLMEFNASGQTDTLNVSGVFNHNTAGGARVAVTPEGGYFSGATAIPLAGMFSGAGGSTLPTVIDSFVAPSSPTLSMTMSAGPVYTVTTTRSAAAYSQYAASGEAAGLGRALDAIAGSAQGDMQQLLGALDFSAPGGGTITSSLPQLSPAAFNSSAQASVDANRMLSGALLRAMQQAPRSPVQGRSSGDAPEVWSAFVMPYGGAQHQRTQGDTPGYDGLDVGVFSGLEREFDAGLSAGFHAALTHRQVDVKTQAGAQTKTDSLYFGVQGQLRPDPSAGGHLHGMARLGIENNTSERTVVIGSYQRTSRSEWVSLAGASELGAGYDWRAGALSFGPLVGLDYGFSWRPAVTETSGGGADLKLDAASHHSLRSALGGQLRTEYRLDDGRTLQTGLRAQWLHDLLGGAYTTRGSFAGADGPVFASVSPAPDRDSLALQGNVSLLREDGFKCSAFAGTELFRQGYSSVEGGLSFSWDF